MYISLTIMRTGGQRQIHLCKNDPVSRSSLLRWPHFQTSSPWSPLLTFSNWSKIFRENDISRSGATFPVNNNLQTPKAHQARQERLGRRWWCFGRWFPQDLLKWENHLGLCFPTIIHQPSNFSQTWFSLMLLRSWPGLSAFDQQNEEIMIITIIFLPSISRKKCCRVGLGSSTRMFLPWQDIDVQQDVKLTYVQQNVNS